MKVWPGYWKNQLKRMHMKVNEDNGKATGTVNRRYQKVVLTLGVDEGPEADGSIPIASAKWCRTIVIAT